MGGEMSREDRDEESAHKNHCLLKRRAATQADVTKEAREK